MGELRIRKLLERLFLDLFRLIKAVQLEHAPLSPIWAFVELGSICMLFLRGGHCLLEQLDPGVGHPGLAVGIPSSGYVRL